MTGQPDNQPIDPELEARIVALILGEASDFERDELRRLCDERPELASFEEEVRRVHGLLAEIGGGESAAPDEEWKLPARQRATVLAAISGEATHEPAQPLVSRTPEKTETGRRNQFWTTSRATVALCSVSLCGVLAIVASQMSLLSGRNPGRTPAAVEMADAEVSDSSDSLLAAFADGRFTHPDLPVDPTEDLFQSRLLSEGEVNNSPSSALADIENTMNREWESNGDLPQSSTPSANTVRGRGIDTDFDADQSNRAAASGNIEGWSFGAATEPSRVQPVEPGKGVESNGDSNTSMTMELDYPELPQDSFTPNSVGVHIVQPDAFFRQSDKSLNSITTNGVVESESIRWFGQEAPVQALQEGTEEALGLSQNRDLGRGGAAGIAGAAVGGGGGGLGGGVGGSPGVGGVMGGAAVDGLGEIKEVEKNADGPLARQSQPDAAASLAPGQVAEGMLSEEAGATTRLSISGESSAGRQAGHAGSGLRPAADRLRRPAVEFAPQNPTTVPQFLGETIAGSERSIAGTRQSELEGAGTVTAADDGSLDAAFLKQRNRGSSSELSRKEAQPVSPPTTATAAGSPAEVSDKERGGLNDREDGIGQRFQFGYGDSQANKTDSAGQERFDYQPQPHSDFTEELSFQVKDSLDSLSQSTELGRKAGADPAAPVVDLDSGVEASGGLPAAGESRVAGDLLQLNNGRMDNWSGYTPPALVDEASSTQSQPQTASPASVGLDEKSASEEAFSTFSLHVSDVSFKLAQAALAAGKWPEAAKVRIEEFVNAFDYGDPLPGSGEHVACRVEQAIHPFLQQRNLLRVSLRTGAAGRASNRPLRLTFLLDNSGSMERIDRRRTVRKAFELLASQLQPTDQVTLISFARQPRLLADRVSGANATQLVDLVRDLPSEGGTNFAAALQLGFEKAREQQVPAAQNRVILLTDGAVNLGDADPESLSRMVESMRHTGIAFDAAGISAEGLNDEVLEALTRKGDGRYYLLDSAEAADEGFVQQIAGALRPSAGNVKVQVEFNPDRVGRYKLLGFEKHRLQKEDFRNDAIDAAEMAAAEAGVAVYQFEALPEGRGDVGSVSVRFRDLSSGLMVENRWPIPYEANAPRLQQAAPSLRIASTAALLAARLRGDPLGDVVDLQALSRLVAGLPDHELNVNRVQQLQLMIQHARQITSE
jgi:Mg-chelatase subunit ChlD